MATVEQFINKAASQIGNNGTTYNMWYWGYIQPAWCAAFQSWVANQIGLSGFKSAAVSGIYAALPKVATRSLNNVKRGDLVCFNWDNRSATNWMDHIGVVEWVNPANGTFGTIEGNTDGGICKRCTRSISAGYFTAFVRPAYTDAQTIIIPPNSNIVIPKLDVDGSWGPATTRAVQKALCTYQDGIVSGQYYQDIGSSPGLHRSSWQLGTCGSDMVAALQRKTGANPDRYFGRKSILALQKYLGTTQDGVISMPSQAVMALQRRINQGKF